MGQYNFKKDIHEGENGENDVIKQLIAFGGTVISKNKNNKYDVIIEKNNRKIKYEIKTDSFCNQYNDNGNIFIETECRNKLSGINVTEAEWFVYYLYNFNEIWYIKTQNLINLIQNYKNQFIYFEKAGDAKSNTKGWLIPRYKFQNHFKIYDSITHKIKILPKEFKPPKIDYDKIIKLLEK